MLSWRLRGNCVSADYELFFANSEAAKRKARSLCMGCSVRQQCLASAMEAEEAADPRESPVTNLKRRYGIFGGLTAFERWEKVYPEAAVRIRKLQAKKRRELRALGG